MGASNSSPELPMPPPPSFVPEREALRANVRANAAPVSRADAVAQREHYARAARAYAQAAVQRLGLPPNLARETGFVLDGVRAARQFETPPGGGARRAYSSGSTLLDNAYTRGRAGGPRAHAPAAHHNPHAGDPAAGMHASRYIGRRPGQSENRRPERIGSAPAQRDTGTALHAPAPAPRLTAGGHVNVSGARTRSNSPAASAPASADTLRAAAEQLGISMGPDGVGSGPLVLGGEELYRMDPHEADNAVGMLAQAMAARARLRAAKHALFLDRFGGTGISPALQRALGGDGTDLDKAAIAAHTAVALAERPVGSSSSSSSSSLANGPTTSQYQPPPPVAVSAMAPAPSTSAPAPTPAAAKATPGARGAEMVAQMRHANGGASNAPLARRQSAGHARSSSSHAPAPAPAGAPPAPTASHSSGGAGGAGGAAPAAAPAAAHVRPRPPSLGPSLGAVEDLRKLQRTESGPCTGRSPSRASAGRARPLSGAATDRGTVTDRGAVTERVPPSSDRETIRRAGGHSTDALVPYGYHTQSPIAAGAFSQVVRARAIKSGLEVAVKTFMTRAKGGKAPPDLDTIRAELDALRLLQPSSHEHIANLVEVHENEYEMHAILQVRLRSPPHLPLPPPSMT